MLQAQVIFPIKNPHHQNKKLFSVLVYGEGGESVVHSIDAVRGVMNTLFSEQAQQFKQAQSVQKTSRGSRLNNATGVNITDAEFLSMMQEKEANKTKTKSKKTTNVSKKTSVKSRQKRTNRNGIGVDDDKENIDDMDYEPKIRRKLDVAIEQASYLTDSDDSDYF
jgi:hypothetical protein